jgi:pyrroline-5-carboxylate reductase
MPASGAARRIVLVGGGKMGGALLSGWLRGAVKAADAAVVEPDEAARSRLAGLGVSGYGDAADLPGDFRPAVVVLAVKPQVMDAVVPAYKRFVGPDTVFLSIAAGCMIAGFEGHLGVVPVVRAMPNTPAAIGRGMTVACANGKVDQAQRALCQTLLEAVGQVAWVEDEALLDPVTAVSGSGPAYVFLLIECLAKAGEAAGLAPQLSARLARETVSGAAELAHQSDESASRLRENVTSPGGTTAAALEQLMAADGLEPLMIRAVLAATERSRELAA